VVLPAPLGPRRAAISPGRSVRLRSSRTVRPPSILRRWVICTGTDRGGPVVRCPDLSSAALRKTLQDVGAAGDFLSSGPMVGRCRGVGRAWAGWERSSYRNNALCCGPVDGGNS
jgi:hypothetical protein